jgi:hypothetical protein
MRVAYTKAYHFARTKHSLRLPLPSRTLPSSSEPAPSCSSICINIQVSFSAFAYLFSEMIQYNKDRVESITELESRLSE